MPHSILNFFKGTLKTARQPLYLETGEEFLEYTLYLPAVGGKEISPQLPPACSRIFDRCRWSGEKGSGEVEEGDYFSPPTHMRAQIYKVLVLQTLCTEPPESFKIYKGSGKKVLKAQIVENLLELLLFSSGHIRVPNLIWRNHCHPVSENIYF